MILRPVLCRPFVGRRAELAYLRERRLEAGASRGSLVFVTGAAGLGKSRLIAEFCRSLTYSRWRIASGPCREFGGSPYGPILSALSSLGAGASQLPPVESKRQYFEAIVDRFAAFAARKALVIAIEDLHWADAATLDLLEYLGSQVHRMRILILASFRADDLHSGHPAGAAIAKIARHAQACRIDLEPLEGVELRTFIDETLSGFVLSREVRQAVALAGEGNPFFTEELLKNAVQRAAQRKPRGERWQIPHSVRTALLERLAPFEGEERRLVTHAAVIGRTFALDLLATVAGVAPAALLETLRRARDFQLIDELEPGVFRFRHGLTREALCGDFLRAELPPLHHKIALTLEGAPANERPLEALAYHWWASGDAEKCAHYNELAGDAARRTYAHDDAIAFYQRALEARDIDPLARGSILEKIANLRLVLSQAEEGGASYAAAADLFRTTGAFEREAACRVRAAMTAYTIALSDTSAPLEAMLARLDSGEYVARSRLHLGIAWLAVALRFPTRAQAHLLRVDPRAAAGATDIAVRYHHVAAAVATALGDARHFRREHAAWLEAARAHGDGAVAGAHYNGAKYFSAFGLHEEARESIEHALRIARDSRNRHAEECAQATAALCYLLSGDLTDARAAVEAVPTSTDNRVNTVFAAAAGAALGAYLGDEGLIEKWFDGFEETILRAPEIECGQGFAELLVRRGRQADAAALLHRVLPECELLRGNVPALLAVASYGTAVDRARAREKLLRATQTSSDSLEHPALALFDAISAVRDGHPEEAPAVARLAAEGFRRFRTPLLEAAALEVAGDVPGALALYRKCGAAYHVRRLDAASTEQSTVPDSIGEGATVLSSREREIALLAARGHSNLEIARTLSISHKTVEKHLGSVYLKLGVSSRRALRSYVGVAG